MLEQIPNSVTSTSKLMQNYRLGQVVDGFESNTISSFADQQGNINLVYCQSNVNVMSPSRTNASGWEEESLPYGSGSETWHSAAGAILNGSKVIFGSDQIGRLSYWTKQPNGKWSDYILTGLFGRKLSTAQIGDDVYLIASTLVAPELNSFWIYQVTPGSGNNLTFTAVFDGMNNSPSVQILNINGETVQLYLLTPKIVSLPADTWEQTYGNTGGHNVVTYSGVIQPQSNVAGQVSFWYGSSSKLADAYPMGDRMVTNYNPPSSGLVFYDLQSDQSVGAVQYLMPVTGWNKVWDDGGSGANEDGALYEPVMNSGSQYIYMGYAMSGSDEGASQSYHAPGPPGKTYWAVHPQYVAQVSSDDLIYQWCSEGTKSSKSIDLFAISNNSKHAYSPQCFTGTTSGYSTTPPSNVTGCVPLSDGYASHLSGVKVGNTSPDNTLDLRNDTWMSSSAVSGYGHVVTFTVSPEGLAYFQFNPNWESDAWTPISKQTDITHLECATGASGLVQCFYRDTSGTLFVVSEIAPSEPVIAPPTFSDIFPIAKDVDTFCLGVGAAGTVECYCWVANPLTMNYSLVRLYQDEGGTWTTSAVSDNNGELQEISTYTTQFKFFNKNAMPLNFGEVSILADAPVSLNINGVTKAVNPDTPIKVRTNLAGELTCVSISTDISAVPLTVWGPRMSQSNAYRCDPSQGLQDYFSDITGTDITDAQNADQQPIFDLSSSDADNMANSLQSMMETVLPTANVFDAKVPSAWGVFLDGGIDFRELDDEEARQHLQELQSQSLPSPHVSFGSVFASIRHGVAEIGKLANIIYVDAQYAVQYMIDGVTFLWQGAMDLARDVVKLAATLFDWAEAKAKDVFQWLAFLFDWDDILNTQQVLEGIFKMTLEALPDALSKAQSWVDQNIQNLEDNAKEFFDEIETKLTEQFSHGLSVQNALNMVPSNPAPDASAGSNIVLTSMMNAAAAPNVYGAEVVSSAGQFTLTKKQTQSVNSIIGQLREIADKFNGSNGFTRAIEDFSKMAAEPENFVNLAINGIMETLKAICIDSLKIGRAIIDVVFQAAIDMAEILISLLETEIYIPFISELYESVANEKLSLISLTSLAIAIPATVTYKAIYKVAPYSDQQKQIVMAILDQPVSRQSIEQDDTLSSFNEKCTALRATESYTEVYMVLQGASGTVTTLISGVTDGFGTVSTFLPELPRSSSNSKFAAYLFGTALVGEWVNIGVFSMPPLKPGAEGLGEGIDWVGYLIPMSLPILDTAVYFQQRSVTGENAPLLPDNPIAEKGLTRYKARLMKNNGEWGSLIGCAFGLYHFVGVLGVMGWKYHTAGDGSKTAIYWGAIPGGLTAFGQVANILREEKLLPKFVIAVLASLSGGAIVITSEKARGFNMLLLTIIDGLVNSASTAVAVGITYQQISNDEKAPSDQI